MKNEFKIGDIVRIIDRHKHYSSFKNMFVKLNFRNCDDKLILNIYRNNCYKVFAIIEHPIDKNITLLAIENVANKELQYLFGSSGVEHSTKVITNCL